MMTDQLDFYSLCAKYWPTTRLQAKLRILDLYFLSGVCMDMIGCPSFNPLVRMQPIVLDHIPTEARAEMLAHYGIVLGDN